MSDVDTDLSDLGLDDEDEEDETPTAAQAQDSPQFRDLRKRLRQAQKEAKEAKERAESNEAFRDKFLATEAPKVLKEAGLPEKLSTLYVKSLNGQPPTVEGAKTWGTENGWEPEEPQVEAQTTAAEGTFAPTVGGDAPGPKNLTDAEFNDLLLKNPGQAMAAMREGRVQFANPEAQAQLDSARSGRL